MASKAQNIVVTPSALNGKLPKGWRMVRFGDVVRDVNEVERDPIGAGLERFVGMEHIEPENLHLKTWGNLADDQVSFTKRFRKGQVLFGKRRAYQRKVAVAEFDGICSSDILTFEPKDDELVPELLPFIVQSNGFFEYALGTSSGSLSPRTRWSQLKDYEFRLPPIDEQRRIAEILVAANEVVKTKRRLLEASSEAKEVLSAHLVLKGVRPAQVKDTPCGEIPNNWDARRLPEIVRDDAPITYGIVQPGEFDSNGVLMILGGDFTNGWVDKSTMFRVKPELHAKYRRSFMSPGDIIMCIVGATTGAVAIVPDWREEANLTQTSARIGCNNDQVLSEFGLAYLRSSVGQGFVKKFLTGSAQPRINIGDFASFWIPVPPLSEQRQIVDILKMSESNHSLVTTALANQFQLLKALINCLHTGEQDVQ